MTEAREETATDIVSQVPPKPPVIYACHIDAADEPQPLPVYNPGLFDDLLLKYSSKETQTVSAADAKMLISEYRNETGTELADPEKMCTIHRFYR